MKPPPHTLTREQFHHLRPHGSYSAYQDYVTTKRAQRAARPIDPFAPLTEQGLHERQDQFGPVMNDRQIGREASREAHAQVDPLLKEISDEIQRRSAAEQEHLAAATANYADLVGGYAPHAQQAYGGAEEAQAGVNSALAQALAGGGTGLAGELQAKLAAAGQNTAPAQTAAQTGVGAGNAQLGTGSAELSNLLAHGAAAQEYGAKLPGIAGAEGLRRSAETAGRYAEQLDTRTGEVAAQLPALIQNLLGDLRSRDEGRRQNRASLGNSERDRALQTGVFGKEYGIKQQAANTDTQRANTESQRAGETARHNRAQEQRDAERLGISVAELRERRRQSKVKARQNKRSLDQKGRAERERERHNRQAEKNKGKKADAKPPWVH